MGGLVVEFRCSAVHSDLDDFLVTCRLDGRFDKVQSLQAVVDSWSESSLITYVGSIESVFLLDDLHQMVVDLRSSPHRLCETCGPSWQNHELLHSQAVSSVLTSVDDVERRSREDVVRLSLQSCQRFDVLVERYISGGRSSPSHCQGNRENGVGTKLGFAVTELVLCPVQLMNHIIVNLSLLHRVPSLESRRNDAVHVVDSLRDSLTHILLLVSVSELECLVFAS